MLLGIIAHRPSPIADRRATRDGMTMKSLLLVLAACLALSSIVTTGVLAFSSNFTRRKWLSEAAQMSAALALPPPAHAGGADDADDADAAFVNPNMPAAPEERCKLHASSRCHSLATPWN